MTTAIYSPSGLNAGIGFAVPVDTVNRVVPQLIAHGRYTLPSIGITVDPRADAMVARAGLSGAMILAVASGSEAERAGLKPAQRRSDGYIAMGDLIAAIKGEPVRNAAKLNALLDDHKPGETVTLTAAHGDQKRDVRLHVDAGT